MHFWAHKATTNSTIYNASTFRHGHCNVVTVWSNTTQDLSTMNNMKITISSDEEDFRDVQLQSVVPRQGVPRQLSSGPRRRIPGRKRSSQMFVVSNPCAPSSFWLPDGRAFWYQEHLYRMMITRRRIGTRRTNRSRTTQIPVVMHGIARLSLWGRWAGNLVSFYSKEFKQSLEKRL